GAERLLQHAAVLDGDRAGVDREALLVDARGAAADAVAAFDQQRAVAVVGQAGRGPQPPGPPPPGPGRGSGAPRPKRTIFPASLSCRCVRRGRHVLSDSMSGHAVAEVSLDSVDLMDPEWFVDGPPHDLFTRMRAEAPIRWNEVPGYKHRGFWSVTRH